MALPGHGAAPAAVSGEADLCPAPIQITAEKILGRPGNAGNPRSTRPSRRDSSPPPLPPAQPNSGSISMVASSSSSTEPEARLGTKESAVVWEAGQAKRL